MFNSAIITPDNDPVYEDTTKLAIAVAINASGKLHQQIFDEFSSLDLPGANPGRVIQNENWRVIDAAKIMVSGIKQHPESIGIDVKFLVDSGLAANRLPPNFTKHLEKATQRAPSLAGKLVFLSSVTFLAEVLLLFASVVEVESCASMPLILGPTATKLSSAAELLCVNPRARPMVRPETFFFGVLLLLCDDPPRNFDEESSREAHDTLYLRADFGWSVFLDTVGGKDPEDTSSHLIHVKQSTPTDVRTNERRFEIGYAGAHYLYGSDRPRVFHIPPEEDLRCVPRAVAQVSRCRQFWTTCSHRFKMARLLSVEPKPTSFLNNFDLPRMEDWIWCRAMHRQLWETFLTPPCHHPQDPNPKDFLNLGPDARALLGWSLFREASDSGPYPQRVLVLLTRGEPQIRWLAIQNATEGERPPEPEDRRQVMLRTRRCCDTCALEHVFSLPGKWALIL